MASASSDILTNTPHGVTAYWDRTQSKLNQKHNKEKALNSA
jgi:hypothetical protein